jgi:glycine/sarcosine N-methyltransferase
VKVKNFFDSVSFFYDNMTDSKKVISSRTKLLRNFIPSDARTATDLGCGTGADSISLGLNGLDITGFDISKKMTDAAKLNAKKSGIKAGFYNYSIDKIPQRFNVNFDIAVSLGNSMTLVEKKLLLKSMIRIFNILKPNGIFILQILNYTLINKSKNRIVNISENPPNIYVRFYDVFGMPMNFNILRFNKNNMKDFELLTTELYPYNNKILTDVLKMTGFYKVETYANLNKEKFINNESKDLVIIAYKK